MRRFWKEVTVGPGHAVLLDGRGMKTPARKPLSLPTAPFAEAVALEWRAAGEQVDADAMPVTRLATTVVDLMPERRDDALSEAAGYARTDLLCYHAAGPADLRARQFREWQPWLDWSDRHLAAPLVVTHDLDPIPQPAASLEALEAVLRRLDDWRLVATHGATKLTGSLVLGLAMEAGALDAAKAFDLSLLDELYEIERWGLEEEQARRQAVLRRDLDAVERFFAALR